VAKSFSLKSRQDEASIGGEVAERRGDGGGGADSKHDGESERVSE
jgi:hypothetical protein